MLKKNKFCFLLKTFLASLLWPKQPQGRKYRQPREDKINSYKRVYDLFIKRKKKNSRGSLAGLRRSICHHSPTPSYPLFPSHLIHPWEGSPSFPGNKSGTWTAGFDVYFSKPPPSSFCLAFFCVHPGTTSSPLLPPLENKAMGGGGCLSLTWVRVCPLPKPLTRHPPLPPLLPLLYIEQHVSAFRILISQSPLTLHGHS